jgi:hypothetical protein
VRTYKLEDMKIGAKQSTSDIDAMPDTEE